jgi:predicted nucleic acid-binding protein
MEREFGTVLEACFSQKPPTFIRTNDALHLASAKVAGEVEFITADVRGSPLFSVGNSIG